MPNLILYDHIESQNGYKVRLALSNLKVEYDYKQVDLVNGEQKEDWFLKLNPNGKVPVLLDEDKSIWESNAILLYIGRKFTQNNLIPQDITKLGHMLQWLFFETSMLQTTIQPARFINKFLPPEKQNQSDLEKTIKKAERALKVMDEHLVKHKFLAGDYSLADISCYGQVYIAPEGRIDLSKFKNITSWQKRVEAQPGYVEMRAKAPELT